MVSVQPRTVARTVPTGITLDENLFNQATREMDFQETAERKWERIVGGWKELSIAGM